MAEVVVTLDSTVLTAPTGSSAKVLFDTTVAFPGKRMAQGAGLKRIRVDITHSHDGSFRLYKSADRGTTWVLGQTIVSAFAAAQPADEQFDISSYDDFKLEWLNGGTDQTTWEPSVSLSDERSSV